jgi:AAA family ATP:ADP antiporter
LHFIFLALPLILSPNIRGSVVVSLLFWGFANEITTVTEAKKYYPLFGLGANVALIFSGQYVRFVSAIRKNLPDGVDKWGHSLKLLMTGVLGCGAALLGIFTFMQQKVVPGPADMTVESFLSPRPLPHPCLSPQFSPCVR